METRAVGLRRGLAFLAVVTGSAICTAPCAGQTVRGLLLERDTQRPINLGSVTMLTEDRDSVTSTLTNEDGFFSITAPESGTYQLVGSALGYRGSVLGPFELDDGVTQVVQFQLGPLPVMLEGFTVSAEQLEEPEVANLVATGFYDRLAEGRGQFLTPGQILASTVRFTPQLFREMTFVALERVAGEAASAPWNDQVWVRPVDPRAVRADLKCPPRVYLDDVFINLLSMDPQPSLDDLVKKEDLEAVEVFRAPFGAPLRYQQDNACGVILLWTKLRR